MKSLTSGATVCDAARPAAAVDLKAMERMTSTFVLVPGAWHGGWAWHPVAQRLQAAGSDAVALTMPGLAAGDDRTGLRLEDAVSYLVSEIERRDLTDVVLVGHSWGGIPITAAAHRLPERVSKVIYYSAAVPVAEVSMNDENLPENAAYVRAAVEASPEGSVSVPFEAFQYVLMQDEPEALQRLVHDLLVPQPGGYMLDGLSAADAAPLTVPVAYVLAENDRALARPGAEFAARAGVEPILVPGSHESLLTHPDEIAKALLSA
jgi:pimeloyl-ACP methyl ester carboxylesterase